MSSKNFKIEPLGLFAASAFRKLSSIYVFSYFPFGFEGRIWDLIVSVPDYCLSFYFVIGNYNYDTGSMTGILEHLKWKSLKKTEERQCYEMD